MQEETISFSLDNAKSPKEKRVAYKSVLQAHAHQERLVYAGQDVEPFTRTKTLFHTAQHGRKKDV